MKQKGTILFFCSFFIATNSFSQSIAEKGFVQFPAINTYRSIGYLLPTSNDSIVFIKQPIPSNFYTTQLGFFCTQEIKFEKVTKISFKFRLGSVAECDKLEGKLQ